MEGIIQTVFLPMHFFPHPEVDIASVSCPLHFLKLTLGLCFLLPLSVFVKNIWFIVGAGSIATRFGYDLVIVWHHKGIFISGQGYRQSCWYGDQSAMKNRRVFSSQIYLVLNAFQSFVVAGLFLIFAKM